MMFVTLFLGILQPRTGELRFCNGGHGPPYRIRGQSAEPLPGQQGHPSASGRAWCMARKHSVSSRATRSETLRLEPGDALYLYSDGITEAADASGALFRKTGSQPCCPMPQAVPRIW
jgi:sigma-B regulation protein RsbU (phosphoserine phosphatase)